MQRSAISMGAALLAFAILVSPVTAGRRWCAIDPIVRLGGVEYQVFVSVPEENVPQVNGPLKFDVSSPKGANQELLFTDAGFNGFGEKVTFKDHSAAYKHSFEINVPNNNDDFPVLVEIYRDGVLTHSVEGISDEMVVDVPIEDGALDNQSTLALTLGGVDYQLVVSGDAAGLAEVDDDLKVEVKTPLAPGQAKAEQQSGFNGFGQKVHFKREKSAETHTVSLDLPKGGDDLALTIDVYRNGELVETVSGEADDLEVVLAP